MSSANHQHSIRINDIDLHYLDHNTDAPPLLLLHSLSANAQVFHGLIAHGLHTSFRVIIPDLRGRGQSEKSLNGYSLQQQAEDMIALLDALGIDTVALCGHSFGGLLGIYMAANYPSRINKLIVLDAAVSLNPLTPYLITYSTTRLFTTYPSWDVYLQLVMKAPFMDRWDAAMLPFIKADATELEDGRIVPTSNCLSVSKSAIEVFAMSERDWRKLVSAIVCPTLLLYAESPFVHGQYIATIDKVIETVALLRYGTDMSIEGNHFTMLFGQGAGQIVSALKTFAAQEHKKAIKALLNVEPG